MGPQPLNNHYFISISNTNTSSSFNYSYISVNSFGHWFNEETIKSGMNLGANQVQFGHHRLNNSA